MADEQDPEMIRRQMEAQRASLAEKLDILENKIVQTVEGAREAVAETVQTVKDSVQSSVHTVRDTVETSVENVKQTFDLRHQVQEHPWAMVGGAVAVGFAAGWLLNRLGEASGPTPAAWTYAPSDYTARASRFAGTRAESAFPDTSRAGMEAAAAPPQESWAEQLMHAFAPELHKLKGLAIGAAFGVLRDVLTQNMPEQLRSQVTDMIDGVTTRLGGERVQEDLLASLLQRGELAGNGSRRA